MSTDTQNIEGMPQDAKVGDSIILTGTSITTRIHEVIFRQNEVTFEAQDLMHEYPDKIFFKVPNVDPLGGYVIMGKNLFGEEFLKLGNTIIRG